MEIYSVDLISKLLLLTPIWWLIGLKFFILHLVSIILFFKMIIISKRNRIKIRINITHKLLLYFILVYVVSITLNIPFNEKSRIIASLYNLSFWIMGFFLMITIYNDNTITIDNGTKQLKVRKFSGNNSIYQRIESYKSKHNITNLSVTEYYSSNSQKITKTVSDVNNITDVWYYVDKNNTVYGISTSGNVPGTDDVVKQIVDKL